ncbi:MAG TPA: family 43 glycosylhydrolase [Abditibacteriaceae bacterium]
MQNHLFLKLLIAGPLFLAGSIGQADTLAYWRFENGEAGKLAAVGTVSVRDTAKDNALAVASAEMQPLYTADVPFGTVPQTGAKNTVAADFRGRNDFFMREQKLNEFDFGRAGSNAWTIEFSFRLRDGSGVQRLVGRDGSSSSGERRAPIQILTVGDETGESFDIRLEILDGDNTFQDVVSPRIYRTGRWYNVAATATNDTLSLYVDQLDGKGYRLVGIKTIKGATNATRSGFSVGRGWYGNPTDWIDGKIDEVRISDVALWPSQFLFVPPAGMGVIAPPPIPDPQPQALKSPLFFGADPHVSLFNGEYWMYITGRDHGPGNPSFFAYSSKDMKSWKEHGPVLQFKDVKWLDRRGRGPWAPGVASKNGKYYFYYSVGPQSATMPAHIGVGVADSPAGPFVDKGAPLLSGGNGFEAIDAMVFNDPASGKSYFYAGGSAGAKLRVFELNPDMISFAREIPVETPPQFTEGAFMHLHNGRYYLSYSHGFYAGASYSVHYATAPTPYGPWDYKGAILVSDETRFGPGHHSFVQDPQSGQWLIVYHRWQHPKGRHPLRAGGRSIAIEPINYGPNGEILPIKMTDNWIPILESRVSDPPTSQAKLQNSLPSLALLFPRLPVAPGVVTFNR